VSPFRPDLVDVWIFRVAPASAAPSSAASGSVALGPAAHGSAAHGPAAHGSAASGSVAPGLEILLLRRSPGRILPGLWQCVSGSLEPGETVTDGALRELGEETGFGAAEIERFYDLDQVNQFHEPSFRAIVTSAIFAVRVGPDAEPVMSHEHDALRWVSVAEALDLAIWPAYRESIQRISENLTDPGRSIWFELTLSGERARK
jgi:8-oxo-dGTP pyrophosphatase MutT (NUDIX family)